MVSSLSYTLAWSPVILILVLAVGFKRSALDLSVAGLVYTFFLGLLFFHTPVQVLAMAGLDGVLRTLPLLLVMLTGIALCTTLLASGTLVRIVGWFSGQVDGEWQRTALLAIGVGTFMEGSGVIAEPVVAPMMRAAGHSPMASAILSIAGYAGLMTLALGGIIVTVLSTATGLPVATLAEPIAVLSLLPTLLLALSVPWIVESWTAVFRNFLLFSLIGLTASLAAWAAVRWVGPPVSATIGGLAVIALLILLNRKKVRVDAAILRDFSPFAVIIAGLASVNLIPVLRRLAHDSVHLSLAVIPGRPVSLCPLSDAYTYLLIALILSLALFPFKTGERRRLVVSSLGKAWRPIMAMALFGAMGQLIAYSGYHQGFSGMDQERNLAWILAHGTYGFTGSMYPLLVPLLGWVGTFLTGYGLASIMLFAQFQVVAAGLLGTDAAVLAAAMAVGASVGSVSSPFKIALATPLCDGVGREGEILRKTIPLGLIICLALGLLVWGWTMIGGGATTPNGRAPAAIPWPESLIASVRAVKQVLGFVSGHIILGVPLDLPVRFLFLGGLHFFLRRRLSLRASATSCMAFLLATELLELIAVRNPLHPLSPDWGDLADIASGIAGILAGELLRRWRTRSEQVPPPAGTLRDVVQDSGRSPASGQRPADHRD